MKLLNVSEKGLEKSVISQRKKLFTFILIFLLSLSLALAVSIEIDRIDYSQGEIVNINITDCSQISVLQIFNVVPELVDMGQGEGDWQTIYNTDSDSSDGKYKLTISCEDNTTDTKYFCVDSSGCTEITPDAEPPADEAPPAGNGGGGGCNPVWSCDPWSFCDIDLTQTRTCYDQRCGFSPKTESRPCESCDESWVCTTWSDCIAEKQTRMCYDEHYCNTNIKKPVLQRVCNQPVTGPSPTRIIPPEQFPPEIELPKPSFWETYKLWLILIPAILIFLAIIIFLIIHFRTPKEEAANIHELKHWVKNSLAKGASKDKIRETIKKHGEWSDSELNRAFNALESKASGTPEAKPLSELEKGKQPVK